MIISSKQIRTVRFDIDPNVERLDTYRQQPVNTSNLANWITHVRQGGQDVKRVDQQPKAQKDS